MIKRFSQINEGIIDRTEPDFGDLSKGEKQLRSKIQSILDHYLDLCDVRYTEDVEICPSSKEVASMKITELIKDIIGEKYIRDINED